jgi:hypothetical protein
MMFTDRHDRLIRDIEIPGVDSGEEEDAHFPGVEPLIKDDIEIPGVDVEGSEASAPQSVEINDPNIPHDDPAPSQVAPTLLIPQVRPAHKYPISPWEMIHLPGGDNSVGR